MSAALSLPIQDRDNRCDVTVFALDCWAALDRFLILGTTGGTYYAAERELRREHLFNLLACLDQDGPRTVARIVEISRSGRAPKNMPAVAALALASSIGLKMRNSSWFVSLDHTGDNAARSETRRIALAALGEVCRIPTDLFAWVQWVRKLRGWGPAVSRAVARWYVTAPIDRLVLHGIKYESRKGVTHADLIRLSHPKIANDDIKRQAMVRWLLNGGISEGLAARLAQDSAVNTTPSSLLPQVAAAEDVLAINGLGSARAIEFAKANKQARNNAKLEAERRERLLEAWGVDIWEKRPRLDRSESARLFGVSDNMLAAARHLTDEADDYLPGIQERLEERSTMSSVGFEQRSRPIRDLPPAPSLFKPEDVAKAVSLIRSASLPHEVVPSHLKRERDVWQALLQDMPVGATLRNLSVMTRVGLLTPGSDAAELVAARFRDPLQLRRSRLHPLAILQALEAYKQGRSRTVTKGNVYRRPSRGVSWNATPEILESLEVAFHLAFHNVIPSGKRIMLGVDISGSMGSAFIGDSWLSARVAAAAMCLVTAKTESDCQAVAYTSGGNYGYWNGFTGEHSRPRDKEVYPGLTKLPMTAEMSVSAMVEHVEKLNMGSTDCALPIRYALENQIEVDAFISYTDNEHNAGPLKPAEALRLYREKMGIPARLVCVGMTATDYTIADPKDPLCLNVVGFDSAAPALIADFVAGRI